MINHDKRRVQGKQPPHRQGFDLAFYAPFRSPFPSARLPTFLWPPEKMHKISKTLCALWNQPCLRAAFRHDFTLRTRRPPRYALIAPIELVQTALALLQRKPKRD